MEFNYIYYYYKYIIYIVSSGMRKRKVFRETVITVTVIAVITLDALKQCIKFENKIYKSPNEE